MARLAIHTNTNSSVINHCLDLTDSWRDWTDDIK